MMSRVSLLSHASLLATVLLLGACSNKSEESAAAPEPAQAQADTTAAAAGGAPAEASADADSAAPERVWPDLWPLVAASVTGTYQVSECGQQPELKPVPDGSVSLAADGKASAPGIEVDMSKSTSLMMIRKVEDGRVTQMSTALETEEDGPKFLLGTGATPSNNMVMVTRGDRGVVCKKISGIEGAGNRPVYQTLAKLIAVSSRKLKCVRTSKVVVEAEMAVSLEGNTATLGDERFELDKVISETFKLDNGGNGLSYAAELSNGRQIVLNLSAPDQVREAMAGGTGNSITMCRADN